MTAQETKLLNAFETTLTGTIGASDLTFTVNSVTDGASNTLTAPCYLILNPDSATNREVVQVTSINTGTKTLTLDNINKRYLTGSAATSGLSHASGSVVRMSPVQQHIEDLNDRVDTVINEAGTAVNTTLFLDEDNMASNSATKGVTQQSVKAYVDSQVTAQDLDVQTDSGNIDIDLDSEALTIAGGEGIDTSATSTTVTIAGEDATTSNKGIASFSSDNFAVSSGAVTIKDSGVSNDELAGSIANAKLANSSITVTDGSSSTAIALGGTATFAAGEGIDVGESSGTVTFSGEDATTSNKGVASFSSDNFSVSSGAVTIKDSGVSNDELAGSIANAKLANSSITVTDGSSSTATALGGTITFSGTSNEVEVAESSGTITIGLPSSITVNVTGNVTGNVSGSSGSTTGNAATATALETARTIGGVSFDGTGNINLPGVNTAGNQNTSGTAADLSATLDETKGGTGLTSFTTGDIVYASGSNTLAKLGIGSSGNVLAVSSGGIVEWTSPTTGDITGVTAGTGLSGGGSSGAVTLNVEASQAITALTGGDLTIYEDANNADVSLKMGTSAAESLTIEVLNGSGNKTAEQINFTTATASGTADHGKMVFAVDETTIATIDDGGIDLASGKEFSVNGTALGSGGVTTQVVYQQAAVDITTDALSIDITPLDVTITPATTSSAIMIACGYLPIQVEDRGSNPYWGLKLFRSIGGGSYSEIHNAGQWGRADSSNLPTDFNNGAGYNFIDKPNTTSQCIYRFQFYQSDTGSAENMGIGKNFTCLSYGIEFSGATEV